MPLSVNRPREQQGQGKDL